MIGLHSLPSVWSAAAHGLQLSWDRLGDAVDALACPRICPICEADADFSAFCPPCRAELLGAGGSACPRCALLVGPHGLIDRGCSECRGRSLGFDAAVALGPYQGPIRDLCLRLKHERNAWLARWVAELVAEARRPALQAEIAADAWVVPVPLHWTKRFTRGYNQAEALACGIGRSFRLPVRSPLRRTVATKALALIGRTERAKIMKNVFAIRRRYQSRLAGRTILLVDDILTSGATARAASRTLKRAGAARVVVVVVARAEGKP